MTRKVNSKENNDEFQDTKRKDKIVNTMKKDKINKWYKSACLGIMFKWSKDYYYLVILALSLLSLKIYDFFLEYEPKSIHEFTVKNIYGNDINLSIYKGEVCVIVNVASECGYAESNYEMLNYVKDISINGKNVKILAFPSNDFKQENGNTVDILNYARSRNVRFDFFDKLSVVGETADPLFQFLGQDFGDIKWNFYKYIVNGDGVPLTRLPSEADFYKLSSALQEYFHFDAKSDD